jgi:hypothetical protein
LLDRRPTLNRFSSRVIAASPGTVIAVFPNISRIRRVPKQVVNTGVSTGVWSRLNLYQPRQSKGPALLSGEVLRIEPWSFQTNSSPLFKNVLRAALRHDEFSIDNMKLRILRRTSAPMSATRSAIQKYKSRPLCEMER